MVLQIMADRVYPPVIAVLKTAWKYLGLKFTFTGDVNIPRNGGAILAINHVGYLDFALAGTGALPVKRYVRFMAKKEIFDNKLAGPLMRGMHHISVDRGIELTVRPLLLQPFAHFAAAR
jgi:1-acyl-sn-glycerol-3-phosphate acyltransferase